MKKMRSCSMASLCLVALVLSSFLELGLCKDDGFLRMTTQTTAGGIRERKGFQNNAEIESMGRFAVEEHNKKENGLLVFTRVVAAKEQVVAGKLYHLTLEAVDAGQIKIYEAKVFVKPWMNFKQLQEFKNVQDTSSSSLAVEQDGSGQGWKAMRTSDPVVQRAAKQAVKAIQQRSNSLFPYELIKILAVKSKMMKEGSTGFYLVMSLRRGTKVEKMGVVVVKKDDNGVEFGKFYLTQMYQVQP